MYLYSGTLSVTTGETAETITLFPGYLFVFPPHTYFQYCNMGNTPIQYLWVHFTGYGAAALLSDCSIPLLTPCNVGFPENTEEKFQALFRTFLIGEPIRDIAAASRLMDICVLFGQTILLHTDFPPYRSGRRTFVCTHRFPICIRIFPNHSTFHFWQKWNT